MSSELHPRRNLGTLSNLVQLVAMVLRLVAMVLRLVVAVPLGMNHLSHMVVDWSWCRT